MRLWQEETGQATLEYALLLGAALVAVVALGALWKAGAEGRLLDCALAACSHLLADIRQGSIDDLLLF